MTTSNILPEHLQEKVRNMPESSHGANRIVVILEDGRRIPDVYVAWGKEIVKVGKASGIPFDVSQVVDVEFQRAK